MVDVIDVSTLFHPASERNADIESPCRVCHFVSCVTAARAFAALANGGR
jgi:hypothetical protein